MAKEIGIQTLVKRIEGMKKFSVRAGVMGGAMYIDTHASVAEVAQKLEYGDSSIPPRPFLRNTVAAHQQEWYDGLDKMSKAYLRGRITLDGVADKLGVAMQTHILATIDAGVPPPNSPATTAAKKARGQADPKPLIDSGTLRDSISYDYET